MSTPQPFPFERLKKYSSREAALFNWLASCFPARDFSSPLLSNLTAVMKKYLGSSFSIQYESVFEAPFGQFVAGLPEHLVIPVVSLTPHPKKVMIEFDRAIAMASIDRMLGGPGEPPHLSQSITPLEEGVLEFLVIKILSELGQAFSVTGSKLRMDRMVTEAASLALLEDEKTPLVLLTFRVRVNQTDGYVRLALSLPLLMEMNVEQSQTVPAAFFEERMKSFGHFRTVLWAEAGNVSLTVSDLENLERGDIILFDEAYATLDEGKWGGKVKLKVGEGTHGGLEASLSQGEKGFSARINSAF